MEMERLIRFCSQKESGGSEKADRTDDGLGLGVLWS